MATAVRDEQTTLFVRMTPRHLVQVLIVGALVGLVTWTLAWLLDAYVYKPILCRIGDASCVAAPSYALVTANILAAVTGLFALVRLQVFRPLLITLAAVISLWSLPMVVAALAWYYAALIVVLLMAVAYAVFAWFARIRSFALSLIVIIVVIVALRYVMYA